MAAQPVGPVSIGTARSSRGLRLIVLPGVPSPWSQAAKAIVRVKRLPHPPGRVRDVLGLLADLLESSGGRFPSGDSLTALDLYWATFCNLGMPLPPDLLPLPERMRPMSTATDPAVLELVEKRGLLAHRDRIYREHLELPVVLSRSSDPAVGRPIHQTVMLRRERGEDGRAP